VIGSGAIVASAFGEGVTVEAVGLTLRLVELPAFLSLPQADIVKVKASVRNSIPSFFNILNPPDSL
jgi:hypothetical protein